MVSGIPGPSQIITISGSTVGVLDPTQPERVLSAPGSKLSFATFHPRTASRSPRTLSARDELCSNKRIVTETLPSGESFWRWVPRAKGVEAGGDEGEWPRVIDICGQHVLCSQDQWDIYKLDPEYECTVFPPPQLSTITRRKGKETFTTIDEPASSKRPLPEDASDDELAMPGNIKKPRRAAVETEDEDFGDSDDEVEMIVDSSKGLESSIEESRKKMEAKRKERREKLSSRKAKAQVYETEDLSMTDLTIGDGDFQPPSYSQPWTTSQPPSYSSQPPSYTSNPPSFAQPPSQAPGHSQTNGTAAPPSRPKRAAGSPELQPAKRMRMEPRSTQRKTRQTSQARPHTRGDRFKHGRFDERLRELREKRDRDFRDTLRASMPQDLFEDFPPPPSNASSNTSSATSQATSPSDTTPAEVPVSLEEKIRRIQEINAYEQARRERDEAERKAQAAEAERRRRQEEARQREQERVERERLEREREQERRRKQQQEEQARWRKQQAAEQERKRKEQQHARFAQGPWTAQRALERYRALADAFDGAKFSADAPLEFGAVPWPVLHRPARFGPEDVDWASVEAFFAAVRPHMRAPDYAAFVEKSHRRFHPDRWRARRVLQSVEDDEVRACLEVAANTVAQAITPLWREVKKA